MPNTPKQSTVQPAFFRLKDVAAFLNLGYSSIYHLRDHDPTFPKAVKLTDKAIGWHRDQIVEWANSRPVATAHGRGVSKDTITAAA